jgi:hypothetical protein
LWPFVSSPPCSCIGFDAASHDGRASEATVGWEEFSAFDLPQQFGAAKLSHFAANATAGLHVPISEY